MSEWDGLEDLVGEFAASEIRPRIDALEARLASAERVVRVARGYPPYTAVRLDHALDAQKLAIAHLDKYPEGSVAGHTHIAAIYDDAAKWTRADSNTVPETRKESHCMRDPSVIGACAGPGACSCECNQCDPPCCGKNPCTCPRGTFDTD